MSNYSAKIEIVTRKQLRGLGLSSYHAAAVTKTLKPFEQKGSTYFYSATEVISSLRQYRERPRIKAVTREVLEAALNVLLNLLGNAIPVAFGTSTDSELSRLTRELMSTISKTNSSLAALKLDAGVQSKSRTKPKTV